MAKAKSKLKSISPKNAFLTLMNVGEATCKDFELLGVKSIPDLSKTSADELYIQLQSITGKPHDPCVWNICN